VTGVVVLWLFAANSFSVYWWLLPKKIWRKINGRFGRKPTDVLRGMVSDTVTGMPVDKVKVYLVDDKFNKVLSKGITDKLGEFQLLIKPSTGYRLAAVKDGFEPTAMLDFTAEGIKSGRVHLKIKNVISTEEKIENAVVETIRKTGGWLWSVWLLWLVAVDLIFWREFGLEKAWLGVAVSLLSLGWWLTIILKKNEME
jgi:hypothetical protein